TMQIVRRIASELRPSVLDQLGLEAAIEDLVHDTTRRTGIAVKLDVAQEFPKLPDKIASHAFRIIQEALTNVTRHAKATRVDVSIRRAGKAIILGVADNGIGFAISGGASNADELLAALDRAVTDLVLLDVSMPGGPFLETLQRLRAKHPTVRVLVLSVHPEDQWAVRALRAGASGYLTKDHSPDQLLDAIRRVYRGGWRPAADPASGL